MALSKKNLRSVMTALAWTAPVDSVAHAFINELAKSQCFVRKCAMLDFITNARIFYTSNRSQMMLVKKDASVDEVSAWSTQFIDMEFKCNIN